MLISYSLYLTTPHFVSAHSVRLASASFLQRCTHGHLCLGAFRAACISNFACTMVRIAPLPRRIPCGLHHAVLHQIGDQGALPRRIPCGLHRQKCTECSTQFGGMCRESVDSFSQHCKMCRALTIFPCSSAAKAIYIAIIGSLGRTIDRFFWCEPHRFLCML